MRLKEYKWVNFVIAFVIIFGLWQIVAMFINKPLFPQPYAIIINIFRTFHEGIAIHVGYSFNRIILGLLFTLAIAQRIIHRVLHMSAGRNIAKSIPCQP